MTNWLDDLERKKKEDNDRLMAEVREHIQTYEKEKEASERQWELIKGKVEPIYTRLEALVARANKNEFYLVSGRGEYGHGLDIVRYNAEQTRVEIPRGELKIIRYMERVKGNEQYLKGEAKVTLHPKPQGIEIWFTIGEIVMGWKKGKWYSKNESYISKLLECAGTVPYDRFTEDKMLTLIKWIATGNEPMPYWSDAIPHKKWTPPSDSADGSSNNMWTYILVIGIILFFLYLFTQK